MSSARSSSTEAARERRRMKGEAQAVPMPEAPREILATNQDVQQQQQQAATTNEPSEMPFDEMIKRELDLAIDSEIKQALNRIMKRQTALMSQESSLADIVKDELGHDSDWYEDLVDAVRNNDTRLGASKEEIYEYLYDLEFTEMRSLDALREMYPVSEELIEKQRERERQEQEQAQAEQQPEPEQPPQQPQPEPEKLPQVEETTTAGNNFIPAASD
jgi:hypothetical protein